MGRRCVTPRQTCPRPDGLGRNLRSKTRWFTGFCNSHQVSHFATFFIDARAEISVVESRFYFDFHEEDGISRGALRLRRPGSPALFCVFLGAARAGGCCRLAPSGDVGIRPRPGRRALSGTAFRFRNEFSGRSARQVSTMILPQVHLRKPCYDFSFL